MRRKVFRSQNGSSGKGPLKKRGRPRLPKEKRRTGKTFKLLGKIYYRKGNETRLQATERVLQKLLQFESQKERTNWEYTNRQFYEKIVDPVSRRIKSHYPGIRGRLPCVVATSPTQLNKVLEALSPASKREKEEEIKRFFESKEEYNEEILFRGSRFSEKPNFAIILIKAPPETVLTMAPNAKRIVKATNWLFYPIEKGPLASIKQEYRELRKKIW